MFRVETVEHQGEVLAAVFVRTATREYGDDAGTHFLTPNDFPLQLGFLAHKAGYAVHPHYHPSSRTRILHGTPEALFLLRGKVHVDFYSPNLEYISGTYLLPGDVVLLLGGGHGLRVEADAELWEVKLGPYDAEVDKARFSPLPKNLPTPPEGFIDNA